MDYSGKVYVIDQVHPDTGKFDEHKVMVGFGNAVQAKAAYHANYAKGWRGMKAVTPMAYSDFKTWVKAGPKNTPLAKDARRRSPPPHLFNPKEPPVSLKPIKPSKQRRNDRRNQPQPQNQ